MIKQQKKDILFIGCTHGNEIIGKEMIDLISADRLLRKKFDYIIGNPKAFEKRKRFVDFDLNRAAPGKKYSKKYELRRAYYLVELFKKYKCIIDIHQTFATDKILIIIPRLTIKALQLALAFSIKDILIWPSLDHYPSRALVSHASCGIEIECGSKTNLKMSLKSLFDVVTEFLNSKTKIIQRKYLTNKIMDRNFYYVYDRIERVDIGNKRVNDFEKIITNNESFFVLPFGKHIRIIGYKMRPVDKDWIFDNIEAENVPYI